jgi:hypothetical protein
MLLSVEVVHGAVDAGEPSVTESGKEAISGKVP